MKHWIERRPEVRKFKKWEASWLAAIIDGEGSIGLYDFGREGRRVQIQMANTDDSLVKRAREIIGCGSTVFRTNLHKTHKGRKQMFQYSLKGSNRCYWVLKQISPFLITKKQKAYDIITELENKPFGRWANAAEKARKKASDTMREIWRKRKLHS